MSLVYNGACLELASLLLQKGNIDWKPMDVCKANNDADGDDDRDVESDYDGDEI
jgi:hypothetical protein